VGRPVLVVDDDESVRQAMDWMLSDEGFSVATAENGARALERVQAECPGLILLDMRMPIMDGWQFARTYRARPGPHAPIVVVTAAADARERAREIGAADFLPKPFDVDDLIRVVSRYCAC